MVSEARRSTDAARGQEPAAEAADDGVGGRPALRLVGVVERAEGGERTEARLLQGVVVEVGAGEQGLGLVGLEAGGGVEDVAHVGFGVGRLGLEVFEEPGGGVVLTADVAEHGGGGNAALFEQGGVQLVGVGERMEVTDGEEGEHGGVDGGRARASGCSNRRIGLLPSRV